VTAEVVAPAMQIDEARVLEREQQERDFVTVRCLKAGELRLVCDPALLPFRSTDELAPFDAITFGIGVKHEGCNLFVLGPTRRLCHLDGGRRAGALTGSEGRRTGRIR